MKLLYSIIILVFIVASSCISNKILIDEITKGRIIVFCFIADGNITDYNGCLVARYDDYIDSDDICNIYNLEMKKIGYIWRGSAYSSDGGFKGYVCEGLVYREYKGTETELLDKANLTKNEILKKIRRCQLKSFEGKRLIHSLDELKQRS